MVCVSRSRRRFGLCFPSPIATLPFLWVLLGCGDGGVGPKDVTTVSITAPATALTFLGETVQLTADPLDEKGKTVSAAEVTWSSSAPMTPVGRLR